MTNTKQLINEIDNISKLANLDVQDIDSLMLEIGIRIIAILKIERLNVWLFNQDKSSIKSVSEYDLRTKKFSKDTEIPRSISPIYFENIERNQLIIVPDVYQSIVTSELVNSYLIPFNIVSLMDVPLRISGELVGVICFEKTGSEIKKFTDKEQTFALSVSLILGSILEAKIFKDSKVKFNELLSENERLKNENEILTSEITDRSLFNLSLLNQVISNLKQNNFNLLSDEYSFQIEKYVNRISLLNEIVFKISGGNKLLLKDYLIAIINNFKAQSTIFNKAIKFFIDENASTTIDFRKALNIGIIIVEIIENSIQYSYTTEADFLILISLKYQSNKKSILIIGDNGHQFNFNEQLNAKAIGLRLLVNLSNENLEKFSTPLSSNQSYELVIEGN